MIYSTCWMTREKRIDDWLARNPTQHCICPLEEIKPTKFNAVVSTNQQTFYHSIIYLVLYQVGIFIPHFRRLRENGYKLWVQCFLGRLGWESVSHDWSIVIKATINQSQVTFVHPNDPGDRCAEILYPFPWSGELVFSIGLKIPYLNEKEKKYMND